MPAKMRQSEALLRVYIAGLIEQKQYSEADSLIESYLNKSWSDHLVYQYGLFSQADSLAKLSKAEKWSKQQQDNAWLLLTLGRLASANKLWVKAEEYLNASIHHGARGESYQLLAEVLSVQEKHDLANDTYKKGLAFMLANKG